MSFLSLSRNACVLVALACFACASAAHAQVIYDNGPINGNANADNISFGYMVSDSFTVSSSSTVTGVQFGSWVNSSDTPISVDWSIGTTAFGSEVGSGTAALTNVFHNVGLSRFYVYQSSFALNQTLGAGAYFLTLQNGVATHTGSMAWDESNGPSTAQQYDGSFNTQRPSESFQILGTPNSVPEPGSLGLLTGMTLTGAAFLRRRKQASKAA